MIRKSPTPVWLRKITEFAFLNACAMSLGYISSVLLARRLGADSFGKLMVAQSAVFIAATISDFGLNQYGSRAIAQGGIAEARLVPQIVGAQATLSAICLGIIFVIAFAFQNPSASVVQITAGLWLLPYAFTLDWFFIGKRCFRIVGFSRLGMQACLLLLTWFCVAEPSDVKWAAALRPSAQALACVALLLMLYRFRPLNTGEHPTPVSTIVGGARFCVLALLSQILGSMQTILIGAYSTSEAAGVYAAAASVAAVPTSVSSLLSAGMYPTLAATHKSDPMEFHRIRKWYQKTALSAACITVAVAIALPANAVATIFGKSFQDGDSCLRILLVASAIHIINGSIVQPVLATGREKLVIFQLIGTIACSSVLSFTLIGSHGAVGAAISFTISVGVGTAAIYYTANR